VSIRARIDTSTVCVFILIRARIDTQTLSHLAFSLILSFSIRPSYIAPDARKAALKNKDSDEFQCATWSILADYMLPPSDLANEEDDADDDDDRQGAAQPNIVRRGSRVVKDYATFAKIVKAILTQTILKMPNQAALVNQNQKG
jgi:hypothetical protein